VAGADPVSHDGHAARNAGGSVPAHPIPRVLFLCTGNSCRSQMAEGWARALLSGRIEAHSAGTHPQALNMRAVRAMSECGIDISQHRPKRPEDIGLHFDAIVTVCDSAHESCPAIPGTRTIHAPFDDPPRLAAHAASEDDAMAHYRRVRGEIRAFVERLPATLAELMATCPHSQLEQPAGSRP
jgi:arsenate reductase